MDIKLFVDIKLFIHKQQGKPPPVTSHNTHRNLQVTFSHTRRRHYRDMPSPTVIVLFPSTHQAHVP